MEPKLREYTDTTGEYKDNTDQQQALLNDKLTVLRQAYGLELERLTDLYGEGVKDPSRPESAAVDRWLRLCDTLTTTDKSMVALVSARRPSHHACYPTDAPGAQRPIISMIIVTNPHDAGISFYPETDTNSAILSATGYRMMQPGPTTPVQPHFDNLNDEPTALDPIIATKINSMNIIDNNLGDRFEVIVAGDTYRELHDAILAEYDAQQSLSGNSFEDIDLDPCMISLISPNLNETRRKRAEETSGN